MGEGKLNSNPNINPVLARKLEKSCGEVATGRKRKQSEDVSDCKQSLDLTEESNQITGQSVRCSSRTRSINSFYGELYDMEI